MYKYKNLLEFVMYVPCGHEKEEINASCPNSIYRCVHCPGKGPD